MTRATVPAESGSTRDLLPGVVILGCPRSGTSMLASMMERRLDYAAPVESHFVRYFDPLVRRLKPRSERELAHLGEAIMCFLRRWVPANNRVRSAERSLAYSLAAMQTELPHIVANCQDYPELVGRLFTGFASRENRRGWVEQSVYADPPDIRFLQNYPAGTKFIHLVRDGRDVWLSWSKTWFRPASLEQSANWWRGHVLRARAWGRQHPRDYCEFRYEDFLRDPDRVLQDLARFIGAELLGEMESRHSGLSDLLAGGGTHDRIGEAPSMQSVGRWKNEMPAEDLARFERIAGDQLRAFEYALAPGLPGRAKRQGHWLSSADAIRGSLSYNNIKRQLKRLLPYICWLRQWRFR